MSLSSHPAFSWASTAKICYKSHGSNKYHAVYAWTNYKRMPEYVAFNEAKAKELSEMFGSVQKYIESAYPQMGLTRSFKCVVCGWWVTGKNLNFYNYNPAEVKCYSCQKKEGMAI